MSSHVCCLFVGWQLGQTSCNGKEKNVWMFLLSLVRRLLLKCFPPAAEVKRALFSQTFTVHRHSYSELLSYRKVEKHVFFLLNVSNVINRDTDNSAKLNPRTRTANKYLHNCLVMPWHTLLLIYFWTATCPFFLPTWERGHPGSSWIRPDADGGEQGVTLRRASKLFITQHDH